MGRLEFRTCSRWMIASLLTVTHLPLVWACDPELGALDWTYTGVHASRLASKDA